MLLPRNVGRPRAARGEITWVGIALLLGALAGGWLAWVAVPAYMLHLEVKQVVRDFANQAVKSSDDAGLVERMAQRIRELAQDEEPLDGGRVERRPAIDLRAQDVAWERLPGDQLHVAFDYERELRLPLLERRLPRRFSVDLTLDVARAEWGSPR
ncbi:MAG TPA: hypothetical protein VFP65_13680 [Anaeromyxobacteraceae bacterium]|nr:hypothetical protein [Anaeromyxobacteraceae bacterium]